MSQTFIKLRAILAVLPILVVFPAVASANGSSVAPTRLTLSSTRTSSYVLITNTSPIPQRYSVSAYRWDESPAKLIALSETDDVVFFPGSFTIGSMQSQRIRVGTTVPSSQIEKTYRILVSELPPIQSILNQESGVGFAASFSIPIYVAPVSPTASGQITDVSIDRDHLRFVVRNTGNVHLVAKLMHVSAQGSAGTIMSTDDSAWFVLANRQREFVLPIPAAGCAAIRTVSIVVDAGNAKFDRTVTPERACT
jgi:fimbrial chaperone protein